MLSVSRETPFRLFISGTGTGVGKTFVGRALAAALHANRVQVAALKPLETGCNPVAQDALDLAAAAGRTDLANVSGFYRAHAPLAPYAASLEGEPKPPTAKQLAGTVRKIAEHYEACIVEGAGGILVPLNEKETVADLIHLLAYPVLLVAKDELGVLSSTLTAFESTVSRGIPVAGVVLVQHSDSESEDKSPKTNRKILEDYLPTVPVLSFPCCENNTQLLAQSIVQSGILRIS